MSFLYPDEYYFRSKWPSNFGITYEEAKEALFERKDLMSGGKLTGLALPFKERILAHMIATCILPRTRSLEVLSKRDLFLLFCIHSLQEVNLLHWILKYMAESCKHLDPSASLPYGMLLTS